MNRQQRSGAGTPGSLGASYASRLANNSPRSTNGDASVRNILSLKSPGGNKDWKSPTSSTLLASRTFTARLDPQVYTDTQSRGLTARLASYYERERLTTPIVNRLYNRAGEFPVVHFHKNELTNSMRTKQPGSSGGLGGQVRIPAPERTTYQSTMRSEILRTGATVGNGTVASVPLTGGACDDATVPNDTYELLAPLDALKEISRKRIHCDEAASSNIDSVKKQRADDVASSAAVAMAEAAETRKAQQYSAGNSKRPRDRTSPTYNSSGNAVKQKRPNTKNNDVLSSLSSSVRLAAAAAALRKQNQSLNNSTVLMAVEPSTARPSQASFVEESSAKDTPDSRNAESNTRECETPTYERKSVVERPEPMVVQPARSHVHQPRFELSIPAETRPQLTLFNSVYNKQAANLLPTNVDQQNGTSATVSSSTANGKTVAGCDDDDDDNRRVSYVKPKASALDLQAPRVTGQTVKTGPQAKSKLALMLSCLSGDLDDDDQVDSSLVVAASKTDVAAVAVNQNASALKSEPIKASAISFGIGGTGSATKPSELSTPKPAVDKPTELEKPTAVAGDVTVITSVVSSALPTPTFTFGSKTTQPAELVSVQPVKPAASAEKKKGGFSFDPLAGVAKSPVSTSSLTTATATATTDNPSVPAAFSFGSGAAVVTTSNVTINTTTTTTSAVAPASVLSYEAKTTIGPAVAATSTAAPSLGGFSFGGVTTSASLAPTFGTLIPTKTTSVASSSAIPVLTFGSTAQVAATTAGQGATTTNSTTTVTIANAAPATFSFGAASKIPVATFGSSAAAPSSVANLFANAQTAATTTAAATTTLSFGGTTAAAAAPVFGASAAGGVGSGTFSFGAVAATTTAAAAATPASPIASSAFGASVAKPSILANPTATVQPTGASIFGTAAKGVPAFSASFAGTPATITTTAAAISFGDLNAAAPAVTTNSTQMFAFGSASTGSSTTFGMPIAAGTGNSNTDAVKAFAFGGGALSAAGSTTSVFGSAAAAAPTFGTSALPALPVAPVVFGAAAATPVFGATSSAATTATPAFGSSLINSKAATATLPSFGSVATNNASATSVFGMAAAPVFGQSSTNNATAPTATVASSVFGSAAPQSAFGSSSNTTSFGGLSAAASAAVPSFGSSAAAPVPSMFGATPTTTAKPFGFGSTGSAPSFGAVTQQPQQQQQQQQTSTFSFGNNSTLGAGSTGGTNTNAASPFSFGGSAAATNAINGSTPSAGSPFAFGAAAVPNVVTGSTPFGFGAAAAASKIPVAISTFGGAPTQAANQSAASPFSFGSSSGSAGPPSMGIVNPSSPFSFGGGSTIAAPTATPGGSGSGAFNFGGGAATGVGTAPMGGMNLFSATSANGGGMSSSVKGRPIRQATRRINK